MPIRVCGLHNVENFLQDADVVVSILDPYKNLPFKVPAGVKHVQVRFHDTEHPKEKDWMAMNAGVRHILNFLKDNKVDLDTNLVIHCHAGVSRSSAVAWLALVQMGMDYKDAFTMLFKQHPGIWPNKMILTLGTKYVEVDQGFLKFVDSCDVAISGRHSDYLGYGG